MKKKSNPTKTVHKIQHGRVRFCYAVGLSLIQIWTDPESQWPEMPEYFRVSFSVETPSEIDCLKHSLFPSLESEKIVLKAIKAKIKQQRENGTSAKPEALISAKKKKGKIAAPALPFE